MTDGVGSETYGYEVLGRTTQVQKVISGTTYTTVYAYNAASELTSITYPSGRVVQPSYDTIGRLSTVASGGTNFASGFGYNPAFEVTGFNFGNGVAASFGYSADRLRLISLSYIKGAQTLFGLNYWYKQDQTNCANGTTGNNGQIQCVTDSLDGMRSLKYTYDALYRLSVAQAGPDASPTWKLGFSYDRYGNRATQSILGGCVPPQTCPTNSVTVDGTTNRITGSPYAYDLNGNMTNDGQNTLTYDAENRVVTSASGGTTSTYTNDGNNLRVKKQVGSGTALVYIFSGAKVIAEYAAGANPNSPAKEYIYTGGQLLATIAGNTTTYHHADHLSARVNTDTNGNVAGQQGHYPYGESWYATNTTTKWQFTTYERDGGINESGDDYAMMRYHVNRLGRFSSPDPVSGSPANPQSLNLYAYLRNDPVNATDPSGAFPIGNRPMFDIPPPPSSGVIWGNTIFDAIHGSPGTWFDFDMHGNLQWGFSIDLWQSEMAAKDQAGKLKDALKELLTNEDCAKWLGGQDRASDILGEFAGVFDVSPGSDWIPRGPSQMQAQADINSNRAIAMNDSRPGPGGGWNGSPFAVFAGAVFNHQSQPAQLTIVIHELAHVAWKGTPMGQFIDINNGLSSAFWISRDCGTAVPEWDNWKVPQ